MRTRLFALVLPTIALTALPGLAPSSQNDAELFKDVLSHERLCVTIWPEKTQVNQGEPFDVKLRVVNSSEKNQSITVWSCSFPSQWQCSNPRIGQKEWLCFSNYLVTVELKPGEAYERKLAMRVNEKDKEKALPFKMGFTPHRERNTYWSNEVVVAVE